MAIPVLDLGDRFLRFTLFAAILAAGVLLAQYSVRDFAKARASVLWPSVEGVVLKQNRWGVTYAYSWSGRTRQSHKERFLTGFSLGEYFKKPSSDANRFVKVYVSPTNPNEAVLHRGGGRVMFVLVTLFGAGLAFIGGGGVAQCLASTQMRPYQPLDKEAARRRKDSSRSDRQSTQPLRFGAEQAETSTLIEDEAAQDEKAGEALSFTDFAEEHRRHSDNDAVLKESS